MFNGKITIYYASNYTTDEPIASHVPVKLAVCNRSCSLIIRSHTKQTTVSITTADNNSIAVDCVKFSVSNSCNASNRCIRIRRHRTLKIAVGESQILHKGRTRSLGK